MAQSVFMKGVCSNTGNMAARLCRFLRMCPGLSRQIIGDLLGENNERCLRVLECFTASFDFTGLPSTSHPKSSFLSFLHRLLVASLKPTDPASTIAKFSG